MLMPCVKPVTTHRAEALLTANSLARYANTAVKSDWLNMLFTALPGNGWAPRLIKLYFISLF